MGGLVARASPAVDSAGPMCAQMRAPLLYSGAIHPVDVVGTLTVRRGRWLCVGLWGYGSCSERRGGREGWKGLELRWLWRRRQPKGAIALRLLRRRERGALLVEVQLGWLNFHVFIQIDHEGPGLDFVGGLWRQGRRCREPLWTASDGVFVFFATVSLVTFRFMLTFRLLGIGITPGLHVRFSFSWTLHTFFRNRWFSLSVVRSDGPLACGCSVTGGRYGTGIGIRGIKGGMAGCMGIGETHGAKGMPYCRPNGRAKRPGFRSVPGERAAHSPAIPLPRMT